MFYIIWPGVIRYWIRGCKKYRRQLWKNELKQVITLKCSHFYHTHIMSEGNWDDFLLVSLIYFVLHIFQSRNSLHRVNESWLNMPFKETQFGDGVADGAFGMLWPLWLHCGSIMTSRSLNMYCDATQCMNWLWIFNQNRNIILIPAK